MTNDSTLQHLTQVRIVGEGEGEGEKFDIRESFSIK